MKSFNIEEINATLKGTLVGNTSQIITGPEQLEMATESQITFVGRDRKSVV